MQHDTLTPLECLPDGGFARAGDVDLELLRRKPSDQVDDMRRHTAVERLRGD
jgi:hypothetical protein